MASSIDRIVQAAAGMIGQRTVWVTTPLAPDVLVFERMTGHEEIGRPFTYELTLMSTNAAIDAEKLLGHPVTVVLMIEGGLRHFNGIAMQFSNIGSDGEHCRYLVTLESSPGLLDRTADCRIFQDVSAVEVIKTILREHAVPFEEALNDSYRKWEYLVQYRESSLHFITRLMEQEGIYFYFKHEEGNHTLVLADPLSTLEPFPKYDVVPHATDEHDRGERDHIDDWHESWQVLTGQTSSTDFDFAKPRANLFVRAQAPASGHPHGKMESYDPPGEYRTSADGEKIVKTRLEALQAGALQVGGGGNARGLQVGALFRRGGLAMVDPDPRKFLIVAMSHSLHVDAYKSGAGGGETEYRCTFTAFDGSRPFRLRPAMRPPIVAGPQTAIVVGPKGEEIWTDEFGRVKVQFHWDREGKHDEHSSCYVRVSQIWAGAKWGAMHIPRIGQEVIVDFLEGDPDRPIIVGRVYNGDNPPPYDLPEHKTQSGIKSRSTKEGSPKNFNELRFEDLKGSEQVYLQAEKDLDILVKNDEDRLVEHDRTEEVKNDETITIGGNRTETVHKDETITIDGNRTESVHKDETISIDGMRAETVGKDESVSVTGARTVSIGKDDSTSVGGKQILTVAKDQNVDVSGARTLNVEKDDTVSVGGKLTVTIGKGEERQVGGKLIFDVADEITIKTGSSSLTMKKSGDITIKGKNITIDGSSKVNISGEMVLKGSKISQN